MTTRTPLPRIMCDCNFSSPEGCFLVFERSLAALAAMGEQLREGAQVTLYDLSGEFEFDAILKINKSGPIRHVSGDSVWLGVAIPGTTRYLDGVE